MKMTKEMKFLALLAAILMVNCISRGDSVLWWMVDDPVIMAMDGITSAGNASTYVSPEGYTVNSARVRVDDGQNTSYLQLYAQDDGGVWQLTQYTGVWTDDGEEPPTWTGTGWVPASLGSFTDSQYSFLIELGYLDGGTWTTLAVSEEASYNNLAQHISLGGVGTQPQVAWAPSAYFAVPEPSSGLLLATGAMLLLLRRRRLRGENV